MTMLITKALFLILIKFATTIHLDTAEIEYLAGHLTPEECRRLVEAAYYKSWEGPNTLDQAERKIPKDQPCIKLLHHWNSAEWEGKGKTQEALEHSLWQMGKIDLAKWLEVVHKSLVGKEDSTSLKLDSIEVSCTPTVLRKAALLNPLLDYLYEMLLITFITTGVVFVILLMFLRYSSKKKSVAILA